MTESGFLVYVELIGLSALQGGGVGHGPRNRTALLRAAAERLNPGLAIEGIEGNLLFATARDGVLPNPALLLDLIEAAYVSFRTVRLERLSSRSCTCDACLAISGTALRLVVHHGRWSRQPFGETPRCSGDDVSVALALLEDRALESGGCALLTDAALRRIEVDVGAAGMRPNESELAVSGNVGGAIMDLEPAWERDTRDAVRVEPQDVVTTLDVTLPVPEPVAWDWLTAPDKRTLWEDVDTIESTPRDDRRAGVGTRYHSLQGKYVDELREVLDWKPFRYWSWDLSTHSVRVRATTDLSAVAEGTRLVSAIGLPKGSRLVDRMRTKAVIQDRVAPRRTLALARLRAMLQVEVSLGVPGS